MALGEKVSEKRSHPRKAVRVRVRFRVGENAEMEGYSRDMSLGGVFVETSTPAPFGAAVVVTMPLPGMKEVTIKGTVRWTEPDGMGVQFGLMGARETHALTQLLLSAPPSIR